MWYKEAITLINGILWQPSVEKVALQHALHRVLATKVISDVDMPPFHKAAMDGYACRSKDLSDELQMIEEIPAGKFPLKSIGPGQCSKIMTGAAVPEGADVILMKENAEITAISKVRCLKIPESSNICYKGEDTRQGDVVLNQGSRLYPAQLAMLASTGYSNPQVYSLPRVAVISTGDELVEPGQFPGNAQIRNSNGYQLTAQAQQCGLFPDYLGIVKDNPDELQKIFTQTMDNYDVILVSGGVSVGDYDYIPEILKNLGAETLIQGLRVRPGKHFLLSRVGNRYIAGLPGNPVSSFVIFEVLIKPLLNKLMGVKSNPAVVLIPIESDYSRKKNDVLGFIPVSLSDSGGVHPVDYHGSAHIQSYAGAFGIMEVPVGTSVIKMGDLVHVRPL
jgi:molybdopterin molybdotransferase